MPQPFNPQTLKACLLGGAIGDALGSHFEGQESPLDFAEPREWQVTDDTQLTLATCEAIASSKKVSPEAIAQHILQWYNKGQLTGLGASTLKALRELQMGGHWALVGREGHYAAGNGAAMRIAPLAFKAGIDRFALQDVCSITHKNSEAYCGALAVFESIKITQNGTRSSKWHIVEHVIEALPDCLVRDRLLEITKQNTAPLSDIIKQFPCSGYVVDSVPLAICAAQRGFQLGFAPPLIELIKGGGDTDTVCSIAGQIMATHMGLEAIPKEWLNQVYALPVVKKIDTIVSHWRF